MPVRARCRIYATRLGLLLALMLISAAPPARADDASDAPAAEGSGEELIFDPELEGVEREGTAPEDTGGGEILFDPELEGVTREGAGAESSSAGLPAVPAHRTTTRVILHSRVGVDTAWTDPREDVVEATEIGVLEMTHERSEKLRFSVGLRARHVAARRQRNVGGGRARFSFDAVPTAGYVDATVAPGMHLRAGYQVTTLGRFDIWTANNFLAVYDARSGPTTMAEAVHVAQPAIRYDLDRGKGFALEAIYVPFFQPHLVTIYGTDYALLASVDQAITKAARDNPALGQARRAVEDQLGRSGVIRASTGAFRTFAPDPNLAHPQGALRATFRPSFGEVSLTAGTALAHLPVITLDPQLAQALAGNGSTDPLVDLLERGPLDIQYPRYSVLSADGATDVGPVQLGLELAYMIDRTFLATGPSSPVPLPGQTDVVQTSARAELVEGTEWVAVVEGFFAYALDRPRMPQTRWLTMDHGRYWKGLAGAVSYDPDRFPLGFEIGAVAFSGSTYAFTPRAEYEIVPELFWELGAVFVQGKNPGPLGAPNISIGGVYNNVDQVFTGLKWMP